MYIITTTINIITVITIIIIISIIIIIIAQFLQKRCPIQLPLAVKNKRKKHRGTDILF